MRTAEQIVNIGVDVGLSGAIAILTKNKQIVKIINLSKTPDVIASEVTQAIKSNIVRCIVIEDVHAMPRQGVCSTFKFGYSKGLCVGLFAGLGYADKIVFVSPQRWQKVLNCKTHGNKNVSKQYIQTIYPNYKVTHRNAEAICLALYATRLQNKEN